MRTKFYLSMIAGVAMTASLASCSNDDVVPGPSEGTTSSSPTTAYANITISMPKVSSRAGEKFEAGDDTEATVNSITLVLYSEDGNEVVGYGTMLDKISGEETPDIESKYSKTVELTMLGDKKDAKKIVAYINTAADINTGLSYELEKEVESYEDNGFIMTNAGYKSGNDWIVATAIDGDNEIYETIAGASESSAAKKTIYVERLAAKITTKVADDLEEKASYTITGTNGEEYELEFDAENAVWAPTGTASTMYLFKNYWGDTDNDNEWMNGTYRSYWAAGVNYETSYSKFKEGGVLNYVSSNSLIDGGKLMGESDYTLEHTYGSTTMADDLYNKLNAATSVIVLGQYKVTGKDADDTFKDGEDGYDFYLLQNTTDGKSFTIFNETQLIKYIFNRSKNLGDDLSAEDFKLVWHGTTKNYTIDLKDDDTNGKTLPAEAELATTNARHYNEGYAYFFIPIEHEGKDAENPVGQYGVVRNHSYILNIKAINSLGAPLDDSHFGTDPVEGGPDNPGEEPITPDPETAAFVNAEIIVLQWHVKEHDVTL